MNKKDMKLNCKIGKRYREPWSAKKFLSGFNFISPIWWSKALSDSFKVLIVFGIIFGLIFSLGFVRGMRNKPIRMNLDYKEEFILNLNGEYLHKPKNSNDVYIKDSKTHEVLKHLKTKDFPLLRKKLAPVAFQLQPVFVGGVGVGGKGAEGEVGLGISPLRYWKMQIEAFLTNHGIYAGTSYGITDNAGIGLGGGMGYRGDQRIILYGRFNW